MKLLIRCARVKSHTVWDHGQSVGRLRRSRAHPQIHREMAVDAWFHFAVIAQFLWPRQDCPGAEGGVLGGRRCYWG